MKRTALSLAALAALTAAVGAQAQSNVTVYGLLDAGVEHVSNSAASGRVTSGGMNTSRWGFRGSEDLGNGLKAVFNLEGGIKLDDGTSDGVLFKRQANVGLEGAFGRVVLGRSFTTVYDFVLPFDPMAYAPSYSWATGAYSTSKQSAFGMSTAYDNLVKYTGKAGDLKFGANYGFGEKASGSSDSARYGVAANYAIGPVNLLATYESLNGDSVGGGRDKNTVYHLGAMYSSGPLKVQAAMRDFKTDYVAAGKADLKATTYWAGVNYQTSPVITLTGAVYMVDVKNVATGADADPVMYVGRIKYALSKRTDLYAAASYSKAKQGLPVGVARELNGGTGDTQRGVIAGIQHRF